ncbi:hypothetical protein LSH36_908g00036 [Paralvinella palmiformis]|uniref:M-phase inducer phosphatase n=1 Tax=Paralvinella palmiformis TaxID=53620 RepID=A0AAD9IYB6_9ANNE|nr:hypothetical protein LSH36_908g00036 [Paralvinella palmiformis]
MFSASFSGESDKSMAKKFSLFLDELNSPSPGLSRLAALPLPFTDINDYQVTSSEFLAPDNRSRDSGIGLDTSDCFHTSGFDSPFRFATSSFRNFDGSTPLKPRRIGTNSERGSSNKRRRTDSISRRVCRSRLDYNDDGDDSMDADGVLIPNIKNDSLTNCCSPSALNNSAVKSLFNDVDDDVIGDFSKPYCLPTVVGKHSDLKSITSDTLASLMDNRLSVKVGEFTILDCRYPYEYEGGHIHEAKNTWNRDQLHHIITDPDKTKINGRRRILVFHCEFSSERGPKMSRFLRQLDRDLHKDSYPALCFPELYLLDGGYKGFYEQFPELCEPNCYRTMLHPDHNKDLKYFRAKSKSCSHIKSRRKLDQRITFNCL